MDGRGGGEAGMRKDTGHMREGRDRMKNDDGGRLQVRESRRRRGQWQRRWKGHSWRYKGKCRNNVTKKKAYGKGGAGGGTEGITCFGCGSLAKSQSQENINTMKPAMSGFRGERSEWADGTKVEPVKEKVQGCTSTVELEARGIERNKQLRRSDRGRRQSLEKEK